MTPDGSINPTAQSVCNELTPWTKLSKLVSPSHDRILRNNSRRWKILGRHVSHINETIIVVFEGMDGHWKECRGQDNWDELEHGERLRRKKGERLATTMFQRGIIWRSY